MSATIVKADVLAVASKLATVSDAAWVVVLAFVNTFKGFGTDEELRKVALCLLAAHLISITGTVGASGATGSVISESAGGLKITYAQPMMAVTAIELSRTTYGQQFLAIMQFSTATRGPFVA
jgi:hypothetical protein